tara:strand:- start:109 stop:927 length:819 start_codon:yes stop_codon:yes gene_type:complete
MSIKITDKGFSLVELIIVLIIAGILAQIGFVSFNRLNRKAKALAARTALINIKKECEINRDLDTGMNFALFDLTFYSIETRSSNNCLGRSDNSLVVLRPDNEEDYPFYYYDFLNNELGCELTEKELAFTQEKERFEGNKTDFELDGWWGRNDRATLTINGKSFTAGVYDFKLGVRNDSLDETPVSSGYRWADNFWQQISKKVNESNLIDNQGNKINAIVSDNKLSINSKSQTPLDLKIVAYNDQGGNNTKPRFKKKDIVMPPKAVCADQLRF